MGQHKHNPTALAAARGELKPLDRSKTLGSYDLVSKFGGSVLGLKDALGKPQYVKVGGCIRRRHPKVRGKAAVKVAKATRIQARESAGKLSHAA